MLNCSGCCLFVVVLQQGHGHRALKNGYKIKNMVEIPTTWGILGPELSVGSLIPNSPLHGLQVLSSIAHYNVGNLGGLRLPFQCKRKKWVPSQLFRAHDEVYTWRARLFLVICLWPGKINLPSKSHVTNSYPSSACSSPPSPWDPCRLLRWKPLHAPHPHPRKPGPCFLSSWSSFSLSVAHVTF